MAGGAADLVDFEEHGVVVAVDANLANFLHIPRLLPLAPELLAAAAEVDGPAGADRLLERLAVHPGDHEHLARLIVLGDRRDQAAGLVEVEHRKTRIESQ